MSYIIIRCYGAHQVRHPLRHSFPTPRPSDLPTDVRELKAANSVVLDALGSLFDSGGEPTDADLAPAPVLPAGTGGLAALIDELATQDHGLVMQIGRAQV